MLRTFGSGWISGVLGFVLGVAALLLMITMRVPGMFSVPQIQLLHENHFFRAGLFVCLLAAFVMSLLSMILRKKKILPITGLIATLLAALIGGTNPTPVLHDSAPLYFGLDF